VLDALAHAPVAVEGRLPWSSNRTFLVTVDAGGDCLRAVYKPVRGERPLWDFDGGLHRRELAAYELSEALGWGLVPPTVVRDDAPYGTGSLQFFEDADFEQHYFTLADAGGHARALRTICAFDIVANNADRKSGHVLLVAGGGIRAIDHGLCFHEDPKLRTVIWDFDGEEVPADLVADVGRLVDDHPGRLAGVLTPSELDALVRRARSLTRHPVFPEPRGDRPPYPWPLV
jgi:uncharacterized repeat protein (TIGR03843 family)